MNRRTPGWWYTSPAKCFQRARMPGIAGLTSTASTRRRAVLLRQPYARTCAGAEHEHALGVERAIGQRHEQAPRALERARLRARFFHHVGRAHAVGEHAEPVALVGRAVHVEAAERAPRPNRARRATTCRVSTIAFSECGSDRSSTSSGPSGRYPARPSTSKLTCATAISAIATASATLDQHQRQHATEQAEHHHDLGRAERTEETRRHQTAARRGEQIDRIGRACGLAAARGIRVRNQDACERERHQRQGHESRQRRPADRRRGQARTAPRRARALLGAARPSVRKRKRTNAPTPRPSSAIDSAVEVACELPMYA